MTAPRVAVLGATGLVGRTILEILHQRRFPLAELIPLASGDSAGRTVRFPGGEIEVREARADAFDGVDLVLSSAGAAVSRELLPSAVEAGAVCIDNTSAFRLDPGVPLVVPEVNAGALAGLALGRGGGIVANPNCSTIQLVCVLAPLLEAAGIERVFVATYQSTSGAGEAALAELYESTRAVLEGRSFEPRALARPIGFDLIPAIDVFRDDGRTGEEAKLMLETPKILGAPVTLDAICVRVPTPVSHGEAVWVQTERALSPDEAREVLAGAPGVRVVDDPATGTYPTPADAAGGDDVLVGRIRAAAGGGLALWVVADNLRKGAALNAVQIAERLIAR